jgi:thiol-disulfide isomerase/thioredoxin
MGAKGDKQRDCFEKSLDEFRTALSLDPTAVGSHLGMGIDLAYLHQDDAARGEFRAFLDNDKSDEAADARAARFLNRVELARSRMAPAFTLTTMDGQHISMDNLAGKVVLIDFWATWCGPCREALPHVRRIAQKFEGQPFVVLSVSLDSDAAKWKDFVAKNEMTWLQYRDGGFGGPMAKMFSVDAIPATFSIDADGVLEDQHVGDENIEGKLKKMIAHAAEVETAKPALPAASQAQGSGN